MKELNEVKGVKLLTKSEQKQIVGGLACETGTNWCPDGSYCCLRLGRCKPDGQSC